MPDTTTSTPVDLAVVIASGATTNTSGSYEITTSLAETADYRLLVDDVWLSTAAISVVQDAVNTGKNASLGTPPALLASSPYPVDSGDTVVAGWVSNPTGADHLVRLFASTATDPAGTPLKSGYTNNLSYYRLLHVTSGTTYKMSIDGTWCSPSTISVGSTHDVERHDLQLA